MDNYAVMDNTDYRKRPTSGPHKFRKADCSAKHVLHELTVDKDDSDLWRGKMNLY